MTIFKSPEHRRQWELHCIHTDGMSDAIGEQPSRADKITDAGLKEMYLQGYQDGIEYRQEEKVEVSAQHA